MSTPASVAENGDPRAELRQIKLKSDHFTDASLESTRRMLAYSDESKELAIRTVVTLYDQGERIDHVEKDMDQINEDMREAQKILRKMGRCCGLCYFPWAKIFSKDGEGMWKGNEDGKLINNQPQRATDDRSRLPQQGGYIARLTNDAREVEMEENMVQVNNVIGNLRSMAVDIGLEVDQQNKQVDRIRDKGASNEFVIAEANKTTKELNKS